MFSSRADYAPLSPVIAELESRNVDVLKLDLSRSMAGDSPYDCALALTAGMEFLTREFTKVRPDLVLLLGDRYETLGAAQIATLFQIPIVHIHGGETSEGSFDDDFRHAITQLASIHFAATEEAFLRLIDTKPSDKIYHVGAPGLDNIKDLPEREFDGPYFLITYHPETKGDKSGHDAILEALEAFPGYGAIWTGVNQDPGFSDIRDAFYSHGNVIVADRMGPKRYLSCMKYAACCIGNSSSFLIEAPALGVPTVNVGDRQKGRLRGPSVTNCAANASDIEAEVFFALNYRGSFNNPYGTPGASKRIADILCGKMALAA